MTNQDSTTASEYIRLDEIVRRHKEWNRLAKLPLTDAVRRAVQIANQEAQSCNHIVLEPIHLLAGLLQVTHCFSTTILLHLLGDVSSLLAEVRLACSKKSHSPDVCWFGSLPKSDIWRSVFDSAETIVTITKPKWLGSQHLLFALAESGSAKEVLEQFGLSKQVLIDHLWVTHGLPWPSSDTAIRIESTES